MTQLIPPVAPRLPAASEDYDARYQDHFTNVLRLYFNQLDSVGAALAGVRGGQYINTPYGSFQRNSDFTFAAADTAQIITFDTTDAANGTYFVAGDGIHVEQGGIYNYQFSIQAANPDTVIHTAYLWLRQNGVDVPGTCSKMDIPAKHGVVDGYLLIACNFYVEMQAGDYIELWGATSNTQAYFEYYTAQTTPFARPSIPAVVATLSFVSSLPT